MSKGQFFKCSKIAHFSVQNTTNTLSTKKTQEREHLKNVLYFSVDSFIYLISQLSHILHVTREEIS